MSATEEEARKKHYEKSVWGRLLTILLGVWLITSPFTFGYESMSVAGSIPTTGISSKDPVVILERAHHMVNSDVITGVLVIIFGILSLSYKRIWPSWIVCFLGIWLQFAPIVFWSPLVSSYLNDSVIGALLIAFSILATHLPWEGLKEGAEVPPGWSYNPSSWLQRIPVIFFGFLGWFISRYLSAYQLGYIPQVWDPFFGSGTLDVITSKLSQSFPISDAGLGAVAYCIEALMGCKGSSRRWRTMPWMVIFFGILVVPLGFCSILLVMMQPIIVGAWCGFCLVTAAGMLIMIALTVDEVVAVLQFLHYTRKKKESFWYVFWKGGCPEGALDDKVTPRFTDSSGKFKAMVRGVNIPWNLLIAALVGVWMMFVPHIFVLKGFLANSDHVMGALVITISIISWAEVTRALRFLNILFGLWILISPWVLGGSIVLADWNNVIVGALLVILSFRRGVIRYSYGTWDRCIL